MLTAPQDGNVVLINPYITSIERYNRDVGEIGGHQMPLGIFYLAAYLKQCGENAQIIDAESQRMEHETVIARLKTNPPKIIAISTTTVAFRNARSLAEMIRSEFSDVVIVIGGPHMTALAEATMQCGVFDFGIVHEGEIAFSLLVKYLLRGEGSLNKIPNLYYRKGNRVLYTADAEFIADLDTIPFPARELCPDITLYKPPVGAYRNLPVVSMITSRGCPFECIFCDNNTFGRTVRFHSADYVIAEIRELVTRFHAKEIAFLDDTFVLHKPRLYKIFRELEYKGIRFSWTCMTRVNNLDRELLRFMRDHGCWQIRIGIESGNQDVLDFIKKGITLEQVRNVAEWCRQLGICVSGFFMIGHHTDTPATIQETIEFAISLPLTDVIVTINTPIPGTVSYNKARDYGSYDESNWTSLNYWTPIFIPRNLTREYMLTKQTELYRRFYTRPTVLLRQLRKIRSFGILKSLLKNTVTGLRFTAGRKAS